jgi:dUTP pyrophosphatase
MPHGEGLALPAYASEQAVGLDLAAAVAADVVIPAGSRELIPTGIKIAVPPGFEAQIRARSGLAHKNGIVVPNAPGTIDPDYRGEVMVILMNLGSEPFTVSRGMRIAQMVIVPAVQVGITVAGRLPDTERGDGGFGSTGV